MLLKNPMNSKKCATVSIRGQIVMRRMGCESNVGLTIKKRKLKYIEHIMQRYALLQLVLQLCWSTSRRGLMQNYSEWGSIEPAEPCWFLTLDRRWNVKKMNGVTACLFVYQSTCLPAYLSVCLSIPPLSLSNTYTVFFSFGQQSWDCMYLCADICGYAINRFSLTYIYSLFPNGRK